MLNNFNTDYPRTLMGLRAGAELYGSEFLIDSDIFDEIPLQGVQLKYWTGSAWNVSALKRWDGSGWVTATLKRYSGTAWE